MKKQSKILIALVAAMLLTSVLSAAQAEAKKKCPRKVKVEVAEVKGDNFSEYVYFKDEIKPLTVELKIAVDGKVKEVPFKVGDEIKGGDILLILDTTVLDKEIKDARAAVTQAEKILKSRKNWKEKSEKAEKQAEEKLAEAQAKLEVLLKKAELYTIKSGIDGRVTKLETEAGMDVVAGTVLAVVVNEGIMKFTIAGEEVASLNDKEKVFVRFETLASGMNGEVTKVGANQAEITLDNGDRKLSGGLQATMKILKKEYSDVVVLKDEQVLRDNGETYVYLAGDKRARKVMLTLGAAEDGRVLVLTGLEKGNILIINGVECLQDNKKIKIVNKLPEKATVMVEEKTVAKPEVAKEEVPAELAAAKVPWPKRFKVGLNFEYHYMTAEGFAGLYGRAIGPGLEIAYRFDHKTELFLGVSYSGKSKNLDWIEGTAKYTMMPFSVGVKYYLVRKKEKLEVFVGAGLQYILFKDTTSFMNEVKENIFGGSIFGGANYKLSDSFYAQAMLQFNLAKKTIDITPAPEYQLDLTNFALKFGVFYTF